MRETRWSAMKLHLPLIESRKQPRSVILRPSLASPTHSPASVLLVKIRAFFQSIIPVVSDLARLQMAGVLDSAERLRIRRAVRAGRSRPAVSDRAPRADA